MKRMITGMVLIASLLLSLLLASCALTKPSVSDTLEEPEQPAAAVPGLPGMPSTGRENVYSVEIELIPSKTVYMPGETVEMSLTLTNASTGEVEPVYVSPLPPELSIVIPASIHSQIIKTLAAGTGEKRLTPGEKVTYDLTWDQKDEEGEQVAPGWYFYEADINVRMESSGDSIGMGGRDRAFFIQYPQGAMERIYEPDMAITAASLPLNINGEEKPVDIVFTLKQVDLSWDRASFFILVTSPDEPLSDYDQGDWPRTHMEAVYTIDGNTEDPRSGNIRFTDNGIEIRCGYGESYLDPVPADAKELTFVINSFGDWEGPWEFRIPLDSELPFQASISAVDKVLPGEDVMYGISVSNLSSGTIAIDPFPPAMWVKDVSRNEVVYSETAGNQTYDIGQTCDIGTDYYPYHPKGFWDQKDNNGEQVAPGWYEIGYEYVILEKDTGTRYKARPTDMFQIVDPDSAMNKNLSVNQSVTAEGVTVTLQRVEMTAVETKIYTFWVPTNYRLNPGSPPPIMGKTVGEYSIDGGVVRQVKSHGGKADVNGRTITWDGLEPIPVDAKELTFVITLLDEREGRWAFRVPLK